MATEDTGIELMTWVGFDIPILLINEQPTIKLVTKFISGLISDEDATVVCLNPLYVGFPIGTCNPHPVRVATVPPLPAITTDDAAIPDTAVLF